ILLEDSRNGFAPGRKPRPFQIGYYMSASHPLGEYGQGVFEFRSSCVNDAFRRQRQEIFKAPIGYLAIRSTKNRVESTPDYDRQVRHDDTENRWSNLKPTFRTRRHFNLLTTDLLCLAERLPALSKNTC